MTITNQAPSVREFEDGNVVTTGTTKLQLTYTKNDDRVTTLFVALKDAQGNIISSQTIDVSTQALGSTQTYTVQLSNGLSPVNVTARAKVTETVLAGSSLVYTAPADAYAVLMNYSGVVGVQVAGQNWPFAKELVLYPSASVTLNNQGTTDVTFDVYEIDQTQLSPSSLTLYIEERDSAGNALYSYQISIGDIPPLVISISQAGTVTVESIG